MIAHIAVLVFAAVLACPFCTAPQATLTERRENAAVVALGELTSASPTDQTFCLHAVLKGR